MRRRTGNPYPRRRLVNCANCGDRLTSTNEVRYCSKPECRQLEDRDLAQRSPTGGGLRGGAGELLSQPGDDEEER